eukprot:gene16784-18479_t
MYSPYQTNIYDLDTLTAQEVDYELNYNNFSGNFNYGDLLTQDALLMDQNRAVMKLKTENTNPKDLTSLQWLQSVSLPMEQGGNRTTVQLMVDPNTHLPVQYSRQMATLAMPHPIYPRTDIGLPDVNGLASPKIHIKTGKENGNPDQKTYPKPVFSYSCLIAMALNNSDNGSLPVSEIYKYMQSRFPYFKTAPDGWKNSVRHNLSLNKAFCKLERPDGTSQRKGCLWSLRPEKQETLEREIRKWKKKHPEAIKAAMANPEDLSISSDSMDDSMDTTTNNTPEHTVPEVTNIKLETSSSQPQSSPETDNSNNQIPAAVAPQHNQAHAHDDSDIAAANAAKDLFGHDLFQDVHAEEFWNDLLSSDTSEHNLNFFDNVQDTRHHATTVELDSSLKLESSQSYYYQQPTNQATQSTVAGL